MYTRWGETQIILNCDFWNWILHLKETYFGSFHEISIYLAIKVSSQIISKKLLPEIPILNVELMLYNRRLCNKTIGKS